MKSSEVVSAVEKESEGKFGFRCGTFYSVRLSTDVLGLDGEGVVRVSMVHYNTGSSFIFYSLYSDFIFSSSENSDSLAYLGILLRSQDLPIFKEHL